MDIINIVITENNKVMEIKPFTISSEEEEGDVVEQVENNFTQIVKNFSKPKKLTDQQIIEYVESQMFSYKGIDVNIVWSQSNNT